MENKYYVYIFLDNRKPGVFKYDDFEFKYEPFYIGKGIKGRIKNHFQKGHLLDGSHKSNVINKILIEGYEPDIIKIKEGLSEESALELEIKMIKLIGRFDEGLGPLTNKTNGGEGISGYKWTEEQLLKIKGREPSNKGSKMSDEQKKLIGDANKGKTWKDDIDRVNAFSKLKSEQYQGEKNPFYGKTHSKDTLLKIRKKIIMYDINMNFIKEYPSLPRFRYQQYRK